MNLFEKLRERAEQRAALTVGLIGAGKFGSMFLAQAARTPGLHVVAIADLNVDGARAAATRVGWPAEKTSASSIDSALRNGSTCVTDDAEAVISHPQIQMVIDATGNPLAGISHALQAIAATTDVIMVNVEADALAGPLLAERARAAGVVYSLAYGDQPALICEMVDWARASGFEVIAAGKGTKYLPQYHASTPDTVWDFYGLSAEQARAGGMNAQMFNSFLDGTKSAIEMAAVANATGLNAPTDGLSFPPCDVDQLPELLRPREHGGVLQCRNQVEVISSLDREGGEIPRDLRWGVYAVFAAPDEYVKRCFAEYGLQTDSSGWFSSMYKPYHLIGLELGISVASVGLRQEPTGQPREWRADVAATAKRRLKAGEMLDGEGGYTVWGRLMPAVESVQIGALPLGLAHGCRLRRDIEAGEIVRWADVDMDTSVPGIEFRREMEREFASTGADASAG